MLFLEGFMKSPLRYQITEYDCGTVTFINYITHLLDRSKIQPVLIKKIWEMSLDVNDEDKHIGVGGTSTQAISDICDWINKNNSKLNLHLRCETYKNSQVTTQNIQKVISDDGVLCFRIKDLWNVEHYVMISNIDDKYIYIFDPYYFSAKENKNPNVHVFNQNQFGYNITIDREYFESNADTYTICSANNIVATAIYKTKGE